MIELQWLIWNFTVNKWINWVNPVTTFQLLVFDFNQHWKGALRRIKANVDAAGASAKELIAWMKSNNRMIRTHDAVLLFVKYNKHRQNVKWVKLKEIEDLIKRGRNFCNKTGHFALQRTAFAAAAHAESTSKAGRASGSAGTAAGATVC